MKTIYWILGILIALLLAVGVYIVIQIQKPPVTNTGTTPIQQNNGTDINVPGVTTGGTQQNYAFKVTSQKGISIGVKDFLHNKETVPDTVNPGIYYLAGSIGYCLGNGTCPSGYKTDDFTVTYNTATEQFSVTLLTLPLADAREKATKFLMDRLGLHRITLCNLRYFVSVPSSIDSKYAGINLGFEVCPGAVILDGQ